MKKKMVVVFPQFTRPQREAIRAAAEAHGYEYMFFENEQDAMGAVADAEILFADSLVLPKAAAQLRWLCVSSAGVNLFVEPGLIASPDAVLTNSSGAYGVTIAEHIVMTSLEILRSQQKYEEIVDRREWKRDLPIRSLFGSRMTLMGTGDIGRETAIRMRAFFPKQIIGVNRSGANPDEAFDRVLTQDRLDEILPETDLLIISLPATAETRHMLGAERLKLLPDGAVVVNVGRGSVIDQKALEAQLRAGRLCAALDVFETEPIPREDPLWECPNLLITPHISGNTTLPYTVERIHSLFLENFENYCAGRPLKRLIDPKKGY